MQKLLGCITNPPCFACFILAAAAAALIPGRLMADRPIVEYMEAPAIQRGTTAQLKLVGANLTDARELAFYEPGVDCTKIEARSDDELLVTLRAEENCPLGMHAFRVRSDGGYSELRTFTVTRFPVMNSQDATQLSLANLRTGCSVVGKLNDEGSHRLAVELIQGERLAVDVEAIRLGGDMIDAAIAIRDPAGQVILQADDSLLYRQDPLGSVVAGHAGLYSIEVQDAGRNAGENAYFVVHVSTGPRPTAIFPLGGQPNSVAEITFTGDCRGPWKSRVPLPDVDPAKQPTYELLAENDGQAAATPIPFRLSPLPNMYESVSHESVSDQLPGNDTFPKLPVSQELKAPLAINGSIEQPLDRDCFWLGGIAGEKLDVQIFAQRLGSACDTQLTVVDSSQRILGQSDDIDGLDSRVEVVVPDDGWLGVMVEDKRGQGGEGFGYRVEVVAVQPTAEVFLPRRDRLTQEMQTVSVPVGNRVLALMAVRKDDASGIATIRFPKLPSGIVAHYMSPPADQAVVPVVFEATDAASLAGKLVPIEISVLGVNGTAMGSFHQVTDLVRGPADAIYAEHHADRLAVCTREKYPISIRLDQPQAALAQDGTLELVVHVDRQSEFHGEVNLTLPWLPAWVDADPVIPVPADQSQAIVRLRGWKQAQVATWPLVVEAAAMQSSRGRRARMGGTSGDTPPPAALFPQSVASNPIELQVRPAPISGQFEAAAAEQGQTVTINCGLNASLEQWQELTNLTATLEGLPNRVEAEAVVMRSVPDKVQFQVRLQPTAPLGVYAKLACRISGKLKGETVSYVVARDGTLTIEKPGQIMRDAQGRPLNRVEAIRKKHNPAKS